MDQLLKFLAQNRPNLPNMQARPQIPRAPSAQGAPGQNAQGESQNKPPENPFTQMLKMLAESASPSTQRLLAESSPPAPKADSTNGGQPGILPQQPAPNTMGPAQNPFQQLIQMLMGMQQGKQKASGMGSPISRTPDSRTPIPGGPSAPMPPINNGQVFDPYGAGGNRYGQTRPGQQNLILQLLLSRLLGV